MINFFYPQSEKVSFPRHFKAKKNKNLYQSVCFNGHTVEMDFAYFGLQLHLKTIYKLLYFFKAEDELQEIKDKYFPLSLWFN